MLIRLVTGTAMIVATVVFHAAGLVALSVALTRIGAPFTESPSPLRAVWLLVPAVANCHRIIHRLVPWLTRSQASPRISPAQRGPGLGAGKYREIRTAVDVEAD